ncbi:MAG: hypothetical protein IJV48_06230 [Ruminococcus sp.]|nr:hypothetical protein [Ruminococcus sp.]
MKRVLSILFCVMIAASMFALTIPANAAVAYDDNGNEILTDVGDNEGEQPTDDNQAEETEAPAETEAETAAEETVEETAAETTVETAAETAAATEAETVAATVAATTAAKTANTPKTSDNFMIFVWIGIAVVAVVGIIISIVVSKKKKAQK